MRSGRRGDDAAEFWRRLHADRLALQRCSDCDSFRFPPGPGCPSCGSEAVRWVEPATQPELAAWVITHPAATARLPGKLVPWIPYALVLVRFPDVEGILLPAFLQAEKSDSLVAGARVLFSGGTPERPRLTAELVSA